MGEFNQICRTNYHTLYNNEKDLFFNVRRITDVIGMS